MKRKRTKKACFYNRGKNDKEVGKQIETEKKK
jgi:hypothetical protein